MLKLDELEINRRIYNSLRAAGIHTVSELCALSFAEVRAVREIGRKSGNKIIEALAVEGLQLRQLAGLAGQDL